MTINHVVLTGKVAGVKSATEACRPQGSARGA
jgi:hypothetical protein